MHELKQKIEDRLKQIGSSKAAMARELNITPQNLNNWLARGNVPTQKLLAATKYLRCDISWLIKGGAGEAANEIAEQPGEYIVRELSQDEIDMLGKFRTLPDSMQKRFKEALDVFSAEVE